MAEPADQPAQPAEKRKHTKKPRIDPEHESDEDLFTHMSGRFSLAEKTHLVAFGTSALTSAEMIKMRVDSSTPWPSKTDKVNQALSELYEHVNDIRKSNELPEINAADKTRLQTGVKKWTKQFLRYGNIDCAAPHSVGWKVLQNKESLTRMHEILLACYRDAGGQRHFYRDTEDAANRNPEFKQLFDDLDIGHPTLWRQLTTLFPGLHITKQPVKRVRDHHETRVCHRSARVVIVFECVCARH